MKKQKITLNYLLLYCALLGLIPSVMRAQVTSYTQRYNNYRTGANLDETFLTPANVNSTQFGKLFSDVVDGQIYAQPLYAPAVPIPNEGVRNVIYVATMNNSIYALDADNAGVQYWKKNFGATTIVGDCYGININTNNFSKGTGLGIVSTPVIDPSTNTLYFLSRNESGSVAGGNAVFTQWINALDITTGNPKFGSPVQITATYTTADGMLTFNPQIQNQRPALTLANGNVYIMWGSFGDQNIYHGWVMSYKASNLTQQAVYVDTSTTNGGGGGIWQAGQGMVVDSSGNLYLSSGNGSFGTDANGVLQTGNSFVKLSPSLQVLDYFTPDNSATLNAGDQDLGASGLLAIPNTAYITGGGKQGVLYLVNTANMGHFNSSQDNVVQEFQAIFGTGSSHIHGAPIYLNTDAHGPVIYVWGENDYLRAFQFTGSNLYNTTPIAESTMTAPMTNANGAMPGGFLSISANGTQNGIVWAATPYNASGLASTVEGVLHAFNADTLTELWNDKQNKPRDEVGHFAKNVPPVEANGKLYVATFGSLTSPDGSGILNVYGLLTLIPNGNYVIRSVVSNLALDVPGGSTQPGVDLDQATPSGHLQQSWNVTNLGGNVIQLTNNLSNLVADNASSTMFGTDIEQSTSSGGLNQQWQVTEVANGVYSLTNLKSGFVMDVVGGSTISGALIDQYTPNLTAAQQWTFQPIGAMANTSLIVNKNSGLVLDLYQANPANAATIDQWGDDGTAAQLWELQSTTNSNAVQIVNSFSGKCVSVSNDSTASQAIVWDWGYNNDPSQQWDLVSAGTGLYNFQNVRSGLVLDVAGSSTAYGGTIWQLANSNTTAEQWSIQPVLATGTYALIVNSTGMSLATSGGGTADGTPLVQSPYIAEASGELWDVTSLGNGQYYALGESSGRAMEVAGGPTIQTPGAEVDIWDYIAGTNQQFTLQDASEGAGYDSILFIHSGQALTVSGASTASGAAIVQDPVTTGATNAQWAFQQVPLLATGEYALIVNSTGMSLATTGGGTADGTPLVQLPYSTGATSELWDVTSLGNGQYDALGVGSGRAVEVAGGPTIQTPGAEVDIWDYIAGTNQQFTLVNRGGNNYSVLFVHSGQAMTISGASTASGAAIVQDPYTGGTDQKWSFQQVPPSTMVNTCLLVNKNSGLVLDLYQANPANGATIDQWGNDNTAAQLWELLSAGNGNGGLTAGNGNAVQIVNSLTGKCVSVSADSTAVGAIVWDWTYGNDPSQQWNLVSAGTGLYNFQNVRSGLLLDVAGGSTAYGGTVWQYTADQTAAQEWSIQPVVTTGEYALVVGSTSMCLTASGGGTADNTPLVQDPYTGTTSQLWNVTSLGNGQYYALGVASGRAIDVTNTAQNGNGLNAGDVIQLYDWKTESAEEFTLQDASEGEGYDSIIFVNSGMAMTVSGASTAAGAAIVQDPVTAGATNAQWEFQTP